MRPVSRVITAAGDSLSEAALLLLREKRDGGKSLSGAMLLLLEPFLNMSGLLTGHAGSLKHKPDRARPIYISVLKSRSFNPKMMLKESFHKIKNFIHRTFRNLKSSLQGDYQKLPKTPHVNPLFYPKMQELDNFYRDFSQHWDSDHNKLLKKKKRGPFLVKEIRKRDEKSSCSGSYMNGARKEEKKTDESSTVCQTCMEGKQVDSSSQIVNGLAQKMKEMEKFDMNDLNHVMDMEEGVVSFTTLGRPLNSTTTYRNMLKVKFECISTKTFTMAEDNAVTVYGSNAAITDTKKNPFSIKVGMAQMLRGGAIVEVTTVEQAKIAESAGACCVIVSDPPKDGISRMPDPALIKEIKQSVSIPLMAKARVGHFVEAQILESVGVDYIDESEVLAIADEDHFINKHNFGTPFICGCRDLGEALRRVREGAAMIRTQGDLKGSGNVVETVRGVRKVMGEIRRLNNMDEDEVFTFSKQIKAPYDIVAQTKQMGRLPVVHFAAGGIVTPADAALMVQLGCDGVFLGPEVFSVADPYKKVRAIVLAVRSYNDPVELAQASSGLEDAMTGLNLGENRVEPFGAAIKIAPFTMKTLANVVPKPRQRTLESLTLLLKLSLMPMDLIERNLTEPEFWGREGKSREGVAGGGGGGGRRRQGEGRREGGDADREGGVEEATIGGGGSGRRESLIGSILPRFKLNRVSLPSSKWGSYSWIRTRWDRQRREAQIQIGERAPPVMALLLSISSTPKTTFFLYPSPSSTSSATGIPSTASSSKALLLPLRSICARISTSGHRRSWTVCMAPDEEKMTRRSPLDFPIEWDRPKPGRRPDIFPQFSPMKTPLPPPMPADPPEEDEEEEEEKKEEEEEDPEKQDPDKPEQ
ncbi:unnamed protein product [Fraxinus pennsylvanica]|uniref:PdxS/SNZ N-terminal domain-containing protein n=1 Tax=Fraxinus pennsylvanica TaxID=56036 RepID=A0AAD1ZCB1_9LAMI|nr:unnamed protein product [Fraxinus pennsylvanica]